MPEGTASFPASGSLLRRDAGARREKLERLLTGAKPRVLDLFAGCGGLSLGFQSEGMSIVGAVEHDPIAAKSHGMNFFKGRSTAKIEEHSIARDVATPPEIFAGDMGIDDIEIAVDVLVGGPPCQAFARVGRAKLREIAEHPEAFKQDDRANLYIHYLDYIKAFQPLAVVIENVPDVINHGGENIPLQICETLKESGYRCSYTLLNAVHYGVPQMRERMFLIALADELQTMPRFPQPTHSHELPQGYAGSRQVALKHVEECSDAYFVRAPRADADLPPAVTAKDALVDLPKITAHLEGGLTRGARKFTELVKYPEVDFANGYSVLMRKWPGFENNEGICDHVIRYLPRDYQIFARMKAGDQYPEAHKLAERMLLERVRSELGSVSSESEVAALSKMLRPSIVPPYDPGKFPNKWRKMEPDHPARTLMAHLGKDSYSHIHYDSAQARTISVREAARLQSFPDGFKFAGAMNAAFRQIGNAVPPLMAKAIAGEIRKALLGVS